MWVYRFDETNLLAASPAFDFFFPIDRRVRVREALVVDQSFEIVAAGKARQQFVLMLEDPSQQISSHTRVQHVRPWAVGHDVDVKTSDAHIR